MAKLKILVFDNLLKSIINLTESEYGFIGDVNYTDKGDPYLKCHAITNISWNKQTREFYKKNAPDGMIFYNLGTLFGEVMTTGKTVISNNPSADPKRGGLPKGHPPLNCFLGLPMHRDGKLVGMIGIANRSGGYNKKVVKYLQPLLSTCGAIIEEYRNKERHKKAEEALRES